MILTHEFSDKRIGHRYLLNEDGLIVRVSVKKYCAKLKEPAYILKRL